MFEGGWDSTWNTNLAMTQTAWNSNLGCDATRATWTSSPGANEHRPINCITWYEAYAFCIYDGGFLPSEAEWNYAASGGADQRVYPWSNPVTSTTIDCSYANFTNGAAACSTSFTNEVGTDSPKGDGKFGQSDLSGNVWEWNIDFYAMYVTPCSDCSNVTTASTRVNRGGSYNLVSSALLSSYRNDNAPTTRDPSIGARCARTP
jgi:formylglycine-generating enzyme required for sulfatase activity